MCHVAGQLRNQLASCRAMSCKLKMSNANRVAGTDRRGVQSTGGRGRRRCSQTDRQLNWQMVVKHTKPTKRIEDDGDRIEPLCIASICTHEYKLYSLKVTGDGGGMGLCWGAHVVERVQE